MLLGNTTPNRDPQQLALYGSILNYNNSASDIYMLERDWAFNYYMIDTIAGSSSKPINEETGKYIKGFSRREVLVQEIVSCVQDGVNLKIGFADTSWEAFREKDTIKSNLVPTTTGRVVKTQPGFAWIEPHFSPVTLTDSVDFLQGDFATRIVDSSGNEFSRGKTNLTKTHDFRNDYVAVQRDSHTISHRMKVNTHYGSDGLAYFWTQGERDMVRLMLQSYGMKIWWSVLGSGPSQIEGVKNGTRGFHQSIEKDGLPQYGTGPMTMKEFRRMIDFNVASRSSVQQDIVLHCGRPFLEQVQSFAVNFLTYSDAVVTSLGGNKLVWNTDIREIIVAGLRIKLVIDPMLQDLALFPLTSNITGIDGTIHQNSGYLMDYAPIPAYNSMKMMPSVEKIHFSSDGSEDEVLYRVEGMIGMGNSNSNGMPYANGYQFTNTDVLGVTCHVIMDNGVSCMADNWAFWRPNS